MSATVHPWLADHAPGGSAMLPGAAFVDLAFTVGDRVGCQVLDELTLEAPLVLSEHGTQIQVLVDAPDGAGRRVLTVHSRPADDADVPWQRNASGTLAPHVAAVPDEGTAAWPPPGATPIDCDGHYDRLAARGSVYGPAFRGLRAAWRDGADVLAEVALPEDVAVDAGSYGLHPALLDACLHATGLGDFVDATDENWVPFAWNRTTLHAVGAAHVRVRISPAGRNAVSLTITDPAGRPRRLRRNAHPAPADRGAAPRLRPGAAGRGVAHAPAHRGARRIRGHADGRPRRSPAPHHGPSARHHRSPCRR
ncbi:polyketide synthase dehydratase domain-containing protein [Actinomadura madurae]|nr:polyketide synthase dehydratase domain-containing protein [Actinomadura madurae]